MEKGTPPHTDPDAHNSHEVESDDFGKLDWHRLTFPLAVQTEMGGPSSALRLTEEELDVLNKLLTKGINGSTSAADEYTGLRGLAAFAAGARAWCRKRGG